MGDLATTPETFVLHLPPPVRQDVATPVKDAKEFIPWKIVDISLRPYDGMWSMNPSIHFDGKLWRCTLRCSDYAMPGGVTIRGPKAKASGTTTRNAMLILDPDTWQAAKIHKMEENDGQKRVVCANYGYEDMRLFQTDTGGLQGIAASLHLDRGKMDIGRPEGATQHQPPEQAIISFDSEYNIVHVRPIRGSWWSSKPQKNWAPFDHAVAPRFLYAIDKGTMFDENGAIDGTALVTPSPSRNLARVSDTESAELRERREREEREHREREEREHREREEREHREREERERHEREEREKRAKAERNRRPAMLRTQGRGAEVKAVRGRTVQADTLMSRPSSPRPASPQHRPSSLRSDAGSSRMVSAGRALPPRYAGLRGGTQLIHVGAGKWLGIGHEMNYLSGRKNYWHTFFLTNSHGEVTSVSDPMKIAKNGIEFAAGMAIDGDRVVVSFGVDDMECKLGETQLGAVLSILKPVEE
jgi:hypothetical protein